MAAVDAGGGTVPSLASCDNLPSNIALALGVGIIDAFPDAPSPRRSQRSVETTTLNQDRRRAVVIMAEKKQETGIAPIRDAAQAESLAEGKVGNAAEDIVHAAEEEFTPEQYRKLLWKIDLIILPLMWVCEHRIASKPGLWVGSRAERPRSFPRFGRHGSRADASEQICSGVQYADKVSISTQATFGLQEDTHLVGQQYSCEQDRIYCERHPSKILTARH